jgi:hypothetical protein
VKIYKNFIENGAGIKVIVTDRKRRSAEIER